MKRDETELHSLQTKPERRLRPTAGRGGPRRGEGGGGGRDGPTRGSPARCTLESRCDEGIKPHALDPTRTRGSRARFSGNRLMTAATSKKRGPAQSEATAGGGAGASSGEAEAAGALATRGAGQPGREGRHLPQQRRGKGARGQDEAQLRGRVRPRSTPALRAGLRVGRRRALGRIARGLGPP